MFTILSSVIRKMHQEPHKGAIKPIPIIKRLPFINRSFSIGRQEDAHEFLRCLLYALHKAELKNAGLKESKAGRRGETTSIHTICGGYLRNQVHCPSCGHNSNTFDPFLDLSLDVSNGIRTLGKALQRFVSKETLDAQNKYKCEHCHKRVCAEKRMTVRVPPNCLTVQFKRFSFERYGGMMGHLPMSHMGLSKKKMKKVMMRGRIGGSSGKIDHYIEYPLNLDLTPAMSDIAKAEHIPAMYDLHGVLVHMGHSTNSGHYYSYIKSPAGQWYLMDDSSVRIVSANEALRQRAYMLFYSRREYVPPLFRTNNAAADVEQANSASGFRGDLQSKTITDNVGTDRGNEDTGESISIRGGSTSLGSSSPTEKLNVRTSKQESRENAQDGLPLPDNKLPPPQVFNGGIKHASNENILRVDPQALSKGQRKKIRKELSNRVEHNSIDISIANALLRAAGSEPLPVACQKTTSSPDKPSDFRNLHTARGESQPANDAASVAQVFRSRVSDRDKGNDIETLSSVQWTPQASFMGNKNTLTYLMEGDTSSTEDGEDPTSTDSIRRHAVDYAACLSADEEAENSENSQSEEGTKHPSSNSQMRKDMEKGPERVEVTGNRRRYVQLLSNTAGNSSFSAVSKKNAEILVGSTSRNSLDVGTWDDTPASTANTLPAKAYMLSKAPTPYNTYDDRKEWNALLDEGRKPKKKKRSRVEASLDHQPNPFQKKLDEYGSNQPGYEKGGPRQSPKKSRLSLVVQKARDGINRFFSKKSRKQ
eukprot:gb/GECG01006252.1/.p1 GENE.gb/GECG01006252.1/~~gb/GECG01006252.1/.p1  ORF type:complete len:762 (+),score=90.99 gb/GECG01006252.1/:1-2286(+)